MKELLFNLQLFAGNEQEEIEENTPTEEVEEVVEETEAETDTEFDDSEEKSVEEEKPTKEQNKINAQRRLAEKQKKEELARTEKLKREGYIKGVKEATNGINPYNQQPIEDEYDIEVYQTMVEMSKKGLDPIEDYAKYTAQKQREAQKAEKDTKEQNLKDANEFVSKYGEDTFTKIANDEEFNDFADGMIGKVSLVNLYEKFLRQQAKVEERAKKLALEKDARRKSSTGGINKPTPEGTWEDLQGNDFRKFIDGIASRR